MVKFAEWYKQLQGLIIAIVTAGLIGLFSQVIGLINYARENRATIEDMKKDIEVKASKEAFSEHVSSSSEQRRQIELDLVDHNERIKFLERK